jgi:hypothetical protein
MTEDELFRAYGLPPDWGRARSADDVLAQLLQLLLVLVLAEVAQGGDNDGLTTTDAMTDTTDASSTRWWH